MSVEAKRVTEKTTQYAQLYRCFNAAGKLLYIGVSYSAFLRFAKHRKADWSKSVGNIKVELFPTREEALAAELIAIRNEQPLFNVIGKSKLAHEPQIIKMTPDELKAARTELGLTQIEFAQAFQVSRRAIGGWEQGTRNGRATAIPAPVALLVKFALKHPVIRRELGIKS